MFIRYSPLTKMRVIYLCAYLVSIVFILKSQIRWCYQWLWRRWGLLIRLLNNNNILRWRIVTLTLLGGIHYYLSFSWHIVIHKERSRRLFEIGYISFSRVLYNLCLSLLGITTYNCIKVLWNLLLFLRFLYSLFSNIHLFIFFTLIILELVRLIVYTILLVHV